MSVYKTIDRFVSLLQKGAYMSRAELKTEAIRRTFLAVYARDHGRCVSCGLSANRYGTAQLAHVIPNRKHNIRKYGEAVIHHPMNLKLTCCLECNAAMSLSNAPIAEAALVRKIRAALGEI